MHDQFIVVLITAPDQQTAGRIVEALLAKKLAACVNIVPSIQSIYAWQGVVQKDQELLLLVKTRLALFQDHLVPAVKAAHPYQVPEIIALPVVMGSSSYLDWITAETTADP